MVWLTANILCLCKLLLVFKVTWHRTFSKMWLNYTAHPFLHPQENINYYYYYFKRNMINKFTHSAFNSFVNISTPAFQYRMRDKITYNGNLLLKMNKFFPLILVLMPRFQYLFQQNRSKIRNKLFYLNYTIYWFCFLTAGFSVHILTFYIQYPRSALKGNFKIH